MSCARSRCSRCVPFRTLTPAKEELTPARLQHIHHPSLVALSASFSTPVYTVLVLEYALGGELFDFIADWHSSITEGLARRMFGELCGAVGWMHEIGLVHRDIKLESVLVLHPSMRPR